MKKKILAGLPYVISYGAMLVLLFQLEVSFLILLAAPFVIGSAFLLVKNPLAGNVPPADRKRTHAVAVLVTVSFVMIFCARWYISPGFTKIVNRLHMDLRQGIAVGAVCFGAAAYFFVYKAVWRITEWLKALPAKYALANNLAVGFAASVVTVALSQIMSENPVMMMGIFKFFVCVLIVYVVFLLLYGLTAAPRFSVIAGTVPFMVLATVSDYVFRFRERMVEPIDIYAVTTAMDVAGNYPIFPIPFYILCSWIVFVGYTLLFCRAFKKQPAFSRRKRFAAVSVSLMCAAAVFSYSFAVKETHWRNKDAYDHGFILSFVAYFKSVLIQKPENYSTESVAKLYEQYAGTPQEAESQEDLPHIIVIMDESFSDFNCLGHISTNTEVMPFVHSLKENTVSGFALCSIYGGGTVSSEYEFLTGNSMAWLPVNAAPYQQFIRKPSYSAVSYLTSRYGYRCMAYHPLFGSGWGRSTTYHLLGFEKSYFIEDFPNEKKIRGLVSDQEMIEKMIDTFNAEHETPLFLFGVTMQNHGGYNKEMKEEELVVSLTGYPKEYPQTGQFLSLLHHSDAAVEYLVNYFSEVDEKVVIVFFGDHQPIIEGESMEEICGYSPDTLDEKQKLYMVPFFVWTNYDTPEKKIDCTSLNYLSSYMYEAAGLEPPVYNRFLTKMEKVIPAMNINGFYSLSAGHFLPYETASDAEREWLENYKILQYNNVFDGKNRNEKMFPVPQLQED